MNDADVNDPVLPAAPFLTGPGAHDAVGAAIESVGGSLVTLTTREVIYRPRRMLVVRYDARVSWGAAVEVSETVLAATAVGGPPDGTLVVEADEPPMQIGVWRYPFDPELPGLAQAVIPRQVGQLLDRDPWSLRLRVRSFRACRRAVVHAVWGDGETYLKVVPPATASSLVERHERMGRAGLPVPEVVVADVEAGLVALSPLRGEDLRRHLLQSRAALPSPQEIVDMVRTVHAVRLDRDAGDAAEGTTLLVAAPRHAAMLRRVYAGAGPTLDLVLEHLRPGDPGVVLPGTVHGDLHDAQLRVDDQGRLVGLLDIDGTGPGDVIDDLGRMVAHLYALAATTRQHGERVTRYADDCREVFGRWVPVEELDRRIAAALVGLATGPFRTQQARWQQSVDRLLGLAAILAGVDHVRR